MTDKAVEDTNISDENQEQHEDKQPIVSAAEDKARTDGWIPEKEWTGDENERPEEFLTAEMFNARGEFIGRIKAQNKRISDMENQFNTRMDNANKIHQQQMEVQKSDLERKRDDAIDLADREAANGYQKDIDKLNEQPALAPAPASNEQATLDEWNTNNAWILGNDPKAAYAKQQFATYRAQGIDTGAAITNMEKDVKRAFPALNNERDRQAIPEKGSKPGKKRAAKKLSMADLTNDELKYFRAMPGAWESEAAYLQAVQDTRSDS